MSIVLVKVDKATPLCWRCSFCQSWCHSRRGGCRQCCARVGCKLRSTTPDCGYRSHGDQLNLVQDPPVELLDWSPRNAPVHLNFGFVRTPPRVVFCPNYKTSHGSVGARGGATKTWVILRPLSIGDRFIAISIVLIPCQDRAGLATCLACT